MRISRHNRRAITAAVVASALVHLAVFIRLPPFRLDKPSELTRSGPDELSVQLVPMPSPRPSFPSAPSVRRENRASPSPAPRVPQAALPPPPPRRPPVLALKEPSPAAPPAPQTAPPATDLASFVEARRRARGESPPVEPQPQPAPGDNANAKANRLAAANLSTARQPMTFGFDPRRSGGVFSVIKLTYDYSEFTFYGWNRDMRRNTAQIIAVNKENEPDIRLAVVHKMISIIRDHEQADFVWESERLGRNVTLSARMRDTRGLEDFMLREFFPDWRRP